jgi:hypothetical protein
LSFVKAETLFGRLITIFPDEVVTEKAFEDEARLKVKVGPVTWLIVVVPAADVIYPTSFVNWEMEEVVRPIVPVAEIVILFPPVRPRFVLAVLVFTRSDRLFAARSAPFRDVSTATPFWVIVPEAFSAPPARSANPLCWREEVADSWFDPDQNGK